MSPLTAHLSSLAASVAAGDLSRSAALAILRARRCTPDAVVFDDLVAAVTDLDALDNDGDPLVLVPGIVPGPRHTPAKVARVELERRRDDALAVLIRRAA